MVDGTEYIFDNVEEAMQYLLDSETRVLSADIYRQKAPIMYNLSQIILLQQC